MNDNDNLLLPALLPIAVMLVIAIANLIAL